MFGCSIEVQLSPNNLVKPTSLPNVVPGTHELFLKQKKTQYKKNYHEGVFK